jgi:hypothetical protein
MGLRRIRPIVLLAALVAVAAPCLAKADFLGMDEGRTARSTGTLDGATEFSYTADAAHVDTTDRAVAGRVMEALAEEPALEGSAITVLVDEGRVRLSGTARDEDQAAYALEIAKDAAGPAVEVTGEDLRPGEDGGAAG